MQTPLDILCKGFPQEFVKYFNYVKNLKFEEKPDYNYLKRMFQDLTKQNGFEFDKIYDWVKNPNPPKNEQYNQIPLNKTKPPNDRLITTLPN